uniref:Transposase n=1 Tax=Globodera rostochiensis TaxID=31243 RepID=A0A914HQ03_GLORO
MEEFWILIFVSSFAINALDKAESVKLELKTFDEIFGEGWWDKGEAEDLKTPAPTNFGQNVHNQIDRQNTQIGQNEPNSTDQLGQIEPNSTDQNPPFIEWKSELGQITPNKYPHSEQKELMKRYYEIKDQSPKMSVEDIAKMLKIGSGTLVRWKKEFERQQFYTNSGHSVEGNAAANVQEIEKTNSGSI